MSIFDKRILGKPILPPLGRAPVPPFPGWWKVLGPGIVWMALAQGSGELIWWPYLIAKYGLGFLFLLVPACLLQWPLTFEIGRYTALTGESIWKGFIRLSPWFALPLWMLMVLSFLWFGAFASAGGTALAALTNWPPGLGRAGQSLVWAYATIAVFLGGLVFSPVLYRFIERFMVLVAVVTVAGLAIACAHPTVWGRLPEFLGGLVKPTWPLPRPWDPADAPKLLTAITFAGLGGFWTLFYSYWLREKGVAMAHHAGHLTGLLAAPSEKSTALPAAAAGEKTDDGGGCLPQADAGSEVDAGGGINAGHWRRWVGFLRVDSGIGIFGNIVTTLMTCLLAFALLEPRGLLPEGWDIATVQSEFFAVRWGSWGRALFLLVAAAFLADTWLSTVDAVSRVNTDLVRSFFSRARRRPARWWYFLFLFCLTAVTCATMPLAQPGPLIVISAVLGFVGTVCFSFAVLALNHVHLRPQLPDYARPGRAAAAAMTLSCITYLALACVYLWLELG